MTGLTQFFPFFVLQKFQTSGKIINRLDVQCIESGRLNGEAGSCLIKQGESEHMDYNEREAQRRQEDRDLNRALIWIGAAIVLEFLLVLVNKYYINYRTTAESINLALAIHAALNGLRWVSLAALAACGVWALLRLKQGGRAGLPLSLTAVSAALLICAQITLAFQDSGVRMLFWLVPAWAALALVYYLYQREFFLSALVSGVGVLGLWFVRHAGASSLYTIGAVVVILLLAGIMLWLKGHNGRLFPGEAGQLLPAEAGYPLMLLSCVVGLAAIAIAAFVGGALSFYLLYAMVAWLFALLVYYTVKMM